MGFEQTSRLAFLIIGLILSGGTYYFYDLYARNQGNNYRLTGTVTLFKVVARNQGKLGQVRIVYQDGDGENTSFYLNTERINPPYKPGDKIELITTRPGKGLPILYSHFEYWGGIFIMGLIAFSFLFVAFFAPWLMNLSYSKSG